MRGSYGLLYCTIGTVLLYSTLGAVLTLIRQRICAPTGRDHHGKSSALYRRHESIAEGRRRFTFLAHWLAHFGHSLCKQSSPASCDRMLKSPLAILSSTSLSQKKANDDVRNGQC